MGRGRETEGLALQNMCSMAGMGLKGSVSEMALASPWPRVYFATIFLLFQDPGPRSTHSSPSAVPLWRWGGGSRGRKGWLPISNKMPEAKVPESKLIFPDFEIQWAANGIQVPLGFKRTFHGRREQPGSTLGI